MKTTGLDLAQGGSAANIRSSPCLITAPSQIHPVVYPASSTAFERGRCDWPSVRRYHPLPIESICGISVHLLAGARMTRPVMLTDGMCYTRQRLSVRGVSADDGSAPISSIVWVAVDCVVCLVSLPARLLVGRRGSRALMERRPYHRLARIVPECS